MKTRNQMLPFDIDTTEDVGGGGGFMEKPGQYHFLVAKVGEDENRKGEVMTGGGFTVGLQCLAGTDESQVGCTMNIEFINGQAKHKDGGTFCRTKQTAFLIAAGIITPKQLGTKGLSVDLQKGVNAQVCAVLKLGDPDDKGKQYLDLSFADIFHVDDARSKDIPKDKESLDLLPKEARHEESYFDGIVATKKSSEETKDRIGDDDLDDL